MKRNLSSFWGDIAIELEPYFTPTEIAQKLNMSVKDFLNLLSQNPSKDWVSTFFKATYCGPNSSWLSRNLPNSVEYYPSEWIIPNNSSSFILQNIKRLKELNILPAQLGIYIHNVTYWCIIRQLNCSYNLSISDLALYNNRPFDILLNPNCPKELFETTLKEVRAVAS